MNIKKIVNKAVDTVFIIALGLLTFVAVIGIVGALYNIFFN